MKIIDDLRKKSGDEEEVARGIMAGAKEFEDSSDSEDDNEGAIGATLFSGRTDNSVLLTKLRAKLVRSFSGSSKFAPFKKDKA